MIMKINAKCQFYYNLFNMSSLAVMINGGPSRAVILALDGAPIIIDCKRQTGSFLSRERFQLPKLGGMMQNANTMFHRIISAQMVNKI